MLLICVNMFLRRVCDYVIKGRSRRIPDVHTPERSSFSIMAIHECVIILTHAVHTRSQMLRKIVHIMRLVHV